MSTTRLFDQDAYLGEFEATVERSVCEGGMYRVLLDQTAFFPEGGGQPADCLLYTSRITLALIVNFWRTNLSSSTTMLDFSLLKNALAMQDATTEMTMV